MYNYGWKVFKKYLQIAYFSCISNNVLVFLHNCLIPDKVIRALAL
jgi:hypothetical protein